MSKKYMQPATVLTYRDDRCKLVHVTLGIKISYVGRHEYLRQICFKSCEIIQRKKSKIL